MEKRGSVMKKFLACLLFAVLAIGIAACQKGNFGDTYIEGQDQQYMYTDLFYSTQKMTESEEGYYFLHQNYLFFADRDTLAVSPFCDKPGCLHEKETETSKTWKCNAYYFTYKKRRKLVRLHRFFVKLFSSLKIFSSQLLLHVCNFYLFVSSIDILYIFHIFYTLISAVIPRISLFSSSIGRTTLFR